MFFDFGLLTLKNEENALISLPHGRFSRHFWGTASPTFESPHAMHHDRNTTF